ncbi:uncharacterized protein [Venturia canescens]|uniref:uncharacterized protein n=1 Tax=Venturia canescens TaxID=32260 RepID=UPI001C9CDACD|nr:uncharacterized protein LOC122414974 [Venturia canescens]
MKRKCCVPSCNSSEKCTVCQVSLSYFKIPKDFSLLKKWEIALGLKDQGLSSRDRICSSHFKKGDILTKRFISTKRPSTNSKIIYEVSKLERDSVPALFFLDVKRCCHKGNKQPPSTTNETPRSLECLEGPLGTSATVTSLSEDTDDSSDEEQHEKRHLRPTRRDYRLVAQRVQYRSRRRQIRAFQELRAKWLAKSKTLEKQTRLLEKRIHELVEVQTSDIE